MHKPLTFVTDVPRTVGGVLIRGVRTGKMVELHFDYSKAMTIGDTVTVTRANVPGVDLDAEGWELVRFLAPDESVADIVYDIPPDREPESVEAWLAK